MESAGPCDIVGWDKSLGPLAAALLNGTFIQGFELDDYHQSAPLHSNAIVLPALLAAAQYNNRGTTSAKSQVTGADFLLATIVGYEVGPRVGLALNGGHMLSQGWHSGAVFGPSASAAAVSKLLELPPPMIEDALGTACTQACGLMSAQFESMVKRMHHGFASRSGLFAALMASEGYTGIKKVYETPYGGFLSAFSQGSGQDPPYQIDELTKSLGEVWQTESIRMKPYAAMFGTFCAIDCIRALRNLNGDRLDRKNLSNIRAINVEMGQAALKHGGWTPTRPIETTGAQMNVAYVTALQLLDGEVAPSQFRLDQLDRQEIWELVGKISCTRNQAYDKTGLCGHNVKIAFEDGHEIAHEVIMPRGVDPPLSNEDIISKWRQITNGVIEEERRAKIEQMVLGVETVDDVGRLLNLLMGQTQNPLS